jgi:hypothetical protein
MSLLQLASRPVNRSICRGLTQNADQKSQAQVVEMSLIHGRCGENIVAQLSADAGLWDVDLASNARGGQRRRPPHGNPDNTRGRARTFGPMEQPWTIASVIGRNLLPQQSALAIDEAN